MRYSYRMTVPLVLFGVSILFGLTLYIPGIWRARTVLAALAFLCTAFAIGMQLGADTGAWSMLLGALGLYGMVNNLRIIERRMHERYLYRVTLRTALIVAILQLCTIALLETRDSWWPAGEAAWIALSLTLLAAAAVLFSSTVRRFKKTAWPQHAAAYADSELPTVTVAIPARDETDDLQACLHSIIANDYPKLEILVLDDCSQERRTPEIIRNFAHAGVRFIQGEVPDDTWLPKNHAYDQLKRSASGDYILFCGVDVRFEPGSIRKLVTGMLHKNKRMMSILPRRTAQTEAHFSVVQAMRYWWELVPPRRLFRRPPVLSSCWIVETDTLERAGGFRAVARSIVPEAHFAKAAQSGDGYSFMRSTPALGIESGKSIQEQHTTAVRTRYPQLHRRPENVFIVAAAELLFLVVPFVLAIAGFWLHIGLVAQLCAAASCVLLVGSYVVMALGTRINTWWFSVIALPVVVLADIVLLHYSMWKYEFSEVSWKGRNICISAMHVVPHLPRL